MYASTIVVVELKNIIHVSVQSMKFYCNLVILNGGDV